MGRREKKSTAVVSNRMYDTLKWVALIVLPAVGAAYFSLSEIWDLPYALQVVGTITVADTFLGAVLGLSTKQYNDNVVVKGGTLEVTVDKDGNTKGLFNADMHPSDMATADRVVFTVVHKK